MKKNLFKLFIDKLLDYPLWVKQAVYEKLYFDMRENCCEKVVIEKPENIYALYEPLITFEGENELKDKVNGLDNNIYNFLRLCKNNYSLLEISLNTFLSIEETSKLFMFCIEQNYIQNPKNKEIYATGGFIAGKFRTGEYFKEKGIINEKELAKAVEIRENSEKPIGEILSENNYITKEDLKNLFALKLDSKKRFILDSTIYPESELQTSEKEKFNDEINKLKKENLKLQRQLKQLLALASKKDTTKIL